MFEMFFRYDADSPPARQPIADAYEGLRGVPN